MRDTDLDILDALQPFSRLDEENWDILVKSVEMAGGLDGALPKTVLTEIVFAKSQMLKIGNGNNQYTNRGGAGGAAPAAQAPAGTVVPPGTRGKDGDLGMNGRKKSNDEYKDGDYFRRRGEYAGNSKKPAPKGEIPVASPKTKVTRTGDGAEVSIRTLSSGHDGPQVSRRETIATISKTPAGKFQIGAGGKVDHGKGKLYDSLDAAIADVQDSHTSQYWNG